MKTVKFFTLGCKVNQYETQVIREQFLNAGFKEIDNHMPADTYVINTCTVTHRADSESFNLIRRTKRENPQAEIIVTGCLTELDSQQISRYSGVSLIVRNQDKNRILGLLCGLTGKQADRQNEIGGISYFKGHTRAFLKIQDGCDNFCSYCKVPKVRGRSRSKPLSEVIREAGMLTENGFKEIVLCGVCLGSYGKDLATKLNLTDVIEALEKTDGLLRIRLSSVEAGDVSDELIGKIAQSKKLCRHLHIPIQSGDDEILRRMNRRYTRNDYLNLISKIKQLIPEVAITTDCLVGFPGEKESNFHNTQDLIKRISPLKVHIFPYSRREATQAAGNFKDEVNPVIIRRRISQLKDIAQGCSFAYRKQFLNKDMDVLVEGRPKETSDFYVGHTDNYIRVMIKTTVDLKNRIFPVRLKKIVKDSVLVDLV